MPALQTELQLPQLVGLFIRSTHVPAQTEYIGSPQIEVDPGAVQPEIQVEQLIDAEALEYVPTGHRMLSLLLGQYDPGAQGTGLREFGGQKEPAVRQRTGGFLLLEQ
jgi:hypothetical protein